MYGDLILQAHNIWVVHEKDWYCGKDISIQDCQRQNTYRFSDDDCLYWSGKYGKQLATANSDSADDLEALNPNHFLTGRNANDRELFG